jgi:hypothetical protein
MVLLHYDPHHRRLWIAGQRCHHGATGALLSGLAAAAVVATRHRPRGLLPLALTGTLLMAHDWKDRAVWFARGAQRDD